MRARRIIEGASFGPEVVKVASDAFEAAWAEIAARFDPSMHEAVRENLAQVTSRRRGKTAAMLSCFALVACGHWLACTPRTSLRCQANLRLIRWVTDRREHPDTRSVAAEQWSRRRSMNKTAIKRIGEGLKKEYDAPRDLPDAMERLLEELRRKDLADKDAAQGRRSDVPPATNGS